MSGNFLMINGKILHVINSTVEVEDGDRIRWSIVTEEMVPDEVMRMMYEAISTAGVPSTAQDPFSVMADVDMSAVRQPSGFDAFVARRYASPAAEVQPAAPADATAPKCDSPNCISPNCAFPGKCIASWQVTPKPSGRSIEDCPGGESCPGHPTAPQELFRNSGPAAPRPLLDGPPLLPARSTYVPCLGQECTGCSDPECWTVRASGGGQ